MFWRFGFANASSIDSLLDRDDVALEAILDEDDLLQECKAQNTRLLDYFQRTDVLQRLYGHVTRSIEADDKGLFKYPYVATEVLCSEIWSIVETSINDQRTLLLPFWETVLDRTADDMKSEMVLASHFAKINAVFLNKKPAEMLAFIQSQHDIVDKLLRHVEAPSIVDLLVRIMQLDEQPDNIGALEWLSSENLIPKLLDMLSPQQSPDVHSVVSDLIKGVIQMATPAPGAGISDGSVLPPSNLFARELAHSTSISKLMSFILADFGPNHNVRLVEPFSNESPPETPTNLPTLESATSSVVHSISIIVELIRKNNSDFFEPYLFHTLRHRLIQIQQTVTASEEEAKEAMESAIKEITDRMGVVHLGPLLEIMTDALEQLQKYLRVPRSLTGLIDTTIGSIIPLTFERFRIVELFAELLHCSGMSLLNRSPLYEGLYDADGRLQGGLPALDDLARVIASNGFGESVDEGMDEDEDDGMEPAMEFPVSGTARKGTGVNGKSGEGDEEGLEMDSDEDMSDGPNSSDDDEEMEEIVMQDEGMHLDSSSGSLPPRATPSPKSTSASPQNSKARSRSNSGSPTTSTAALKPAATITIPDAPINIPELLAAQSPGGVGSGTTPTSAMSPADIARMNALGAAASARPSSPFTSSPVGSPGPGGSPRAPRSNTSRRSSRRNLVSSSQNLASTDRLSVYSQLPTYVPVGEKLKRTFVDKKVLETLLDLFFEFPWNNFLHSAVYDVVHQILTGPVEGLGGSAGFGATSGGGGGQGGGGMNRELAVALFRDARLMHRIVEGQKRNDEEVAKPKGVRLGYMGHLTMMADDVLMVLERFPPELRLILIEHAPDPEWDAYVTGRYNETKKRDVALLGGGKPVVGPGAGFGPGGGSGQKTKWKVDEEDDAAVGVGAGAGKKASFVMDDKMGGDDDEGGDGTKGVFTRSLGGRLRREGSADFGVPEFPVDEEDEDDGTPPQFAHYLAHEMNSASNFNSHGSDEEDDEEDDDTGWLSQSNFHQREAEVMFAHAPKKPLSAVASDDPFNPGSPKTRKVSADPFSSDDDAFGTFASAPSSSSGPTISTSKSSDPFGFPTSSPSSSSAKDEDHAMSDTTSPSTSFDDSFGDFGEFQTAEMSSSFEENDEGDGDGQLTPTAGSWTFASSGSGSGSLSGSDFGEEGVAGSGSKEGSASPNPNVMEKEGQVHGEEKDAVKKGET